MTKRHSHVSRAMAERALLELRRRFADYLEHDPEGPKLYEPGYHASGWVIAWDGGPEDWTLAASERIREVPQLSKYGIWSEAINHWSIQLIRD